ncbi:MAG: hypothetical protein QW568_03110 [Candidatus Anstonellaceae archaeon]
MDWRAQDFRARNLAKKVLDVFGSDPNVTITENLDVSLEKLHVFSEFSKLRTVYVRLPHNLDWSEPINLQEQEMQNNRPNRLIATLQHANFIDMILASGAKVIIGFCDKDMQTDHDSQGREIKRPIMPEEVYTRDPLQVVGGTALRGKMKTDVRAPETMAVNGGVLDVPGGCIEFGDFFVVRKGQVLVTSGRRTDEPAIAGAINVINASDGTAWTAHILPKEDSILHGDCVTGAIPTNDGNSFEGAYVYPNAYLNPTHAIEVLKNIYGRVIGILSDSTRKVLGANLLWLDPTIALVNSAAEKMALLLETYGKEVLRPNLGEIGKGDGSGRCSSAPLYRD